MICGINWGGKPDGVDDGNSGKFTFSDKTNKCPYTNALIAWLEVWGVPVDRSNPGKLERCFIQTNWCDSQSKNADGISDRDYARTELFKLITEYQPRAIVLTAVSLFSRFQSRAGDAGLKVVKVHDPYLLKTATGKQFRAWLAEYDKTNVLAVPHPSLFASIIGKSIKDWEKPARAALSKVIDEQGAYKPLRS